jgi:hypothetical protein
MAMIVTRMTLLVAFAAGSSAMAHQAQPAPNPPITVTGEKPAPVDKTLCKLMSTGTSIPKRICLPKSEWAKVSQRSDDSLRAMRDWQRVRCNYGSTC